MPNPTKACKECPFRKSIEPGKLGGSPVEVYLGQIVGPFVIPCHMHIDYSEEDWKAKALEYPQCAGAAQLRTALGVDKIMPNGIHTMPCSDDVFQSPAEFLAHHSGKSLKEAKELTDQKHLEEAFRKELKRKGLRFHAS